MQLRLTSVSCYRNAGKMTTNGLLYSGQCGRIEAGNGEIS